jgi:hypothetical protein
MSKLEDRLKAAGDLSQEQTVADQETTDDLAERGLLGRE